MRVIIEDDLFAIALKSIHQPLGTSDPAILDQAAERNRALLPGIVALDPTMTNAAALLADSSYPIGYNRTFDALGAQLLNPAVEFVLPEEGAMLWIDTFVVPTSSTRKSPAWQFVDFILCPEMNDLITNESFVATANERATQFIDPALDFSQRSRSRRISGRTATGHYILSYRHQLWQELKSITTR
ncbi:ABC transporter substrate-binding protein [Chloroflexus sp.]|uniref:ABC transporter substrate-binding protein n=1 Tax=Chloroflexus sp. TaxID=1904827 RepID=UPI004049724C